MAEQKRNTRNTKSTKVQPVNDYGRIQPQAPELDNMSWWSHFTTQLSNIKRTSHFFQFSAFAKLFLYSESPKFILILGKAIIRLFTILQFTICSGAHHN